MPPTLGLEFRTLLPESGAERLELVRTRVAFPKLLGVWYHEYHAHRAEVRATAGRLSTAGREPVDGPADRRGYGWFGVPLLAHQSQQGPHKQPRLREDGGDRQGDGLPA